MGWRDELKRQIEAIGDDGWDDEYIVLPNGGALSVESKKISVRFGPIFRGNLMGLIGSVNGDRLCGRDRGTIMLSGLERFLNTAGMGENIAVFTVREDGSWNSIPSFRDGLLEWTEFVDAAGKPMYPYADFDLDGDSEPPPHKVNFREFT